MKERAKQTRRYKKALQEANSNAAPGESANGKPLKPKKNKKKIDESADGPEIEVQVHGVYFPIHSDCFRR